MSAQPTASPDNLSAVSRPAEPSPNQDDRMPSVVVARASTDSTSRVAMNTMHRHESNDPPGYHDTVSNAPSDVTTSLGEPSGTSDEWLRLPNGQLINAKNTLASHSTVAAANVTTVSYKKTEETRNVDHAAATTADSPPVARRGPDEEADVHPVTRRNHSSCRHGLLDTDTPSEVSETDLEWNKELQHGTSAFDTSNSATLKAVRRHDQIADPFASVLLVHDSTVGTNPLPPVQSMHPHTIAPPHQSGSPNMVLNVDNSPVVPNWNWMLKTRLVLMALIFLTIGTLMGVCLSGKCSSSSPTIQSPAAPVLPPLVAVPSGNPAATPVNAAMPPTNTTIPGNTSVLMPAPQPAPTFAPVTDDPTTEQNANPRPAPTISTETPTSTTRAMELTDYINSITLSGRTVAVATDIGNALPEQLALQWLIELDALPLSPTIPAQAFQLGQRYALKTLWVGRNASDPFIGSTDEECEWDGITCQAMNLNDIGSASVVTEIEWWGYGWTGQMVSDLGLLSHLEVFNMLGNDLTGSLPDSIGFWTNLERFDVSNNDLTGSLPESIGNWTNLEQFVVYINQLTGSLPESIGNWSSLRIGWFFDNNFNGSVPIGLCNAFNLTYIGVECGFKCSCNECDDNCI